MKLIVKLVILTTLVSNVYAVSKCELYPIRNGNLYGYIDKKGKTIIKPQFNSAARFSEGLAQVRLNGTYGYINSMGTFVISPKYDFALSFCNGIAKVFLDGKPFFIDHQGNIIFHHSFKSIQEFGNNTFAIIVTKTDKYGVIDRSGNLIIDTVFKKISTFINGVAVVTGFNHYQNLDENKKIKKYEIGVIDTLGDWIVNYGEYSGIGEFKNGYSKVKLLGKKLSDSDDESGIIDQKGKYRFTIPTKKWDFDYMNSYFYHELAIVNIMLLDPDSIKMWSSMHRKIYKGVINNNGDIILSNKDWIELTPFANNRAFVKDVNENWYLINKKGEMIGDSTFTSIAYEEYNGNPDDIFFNGKALVKLVNGWVTIDTLGRILSQPINLNGFVSRNIQYVGDMIKLRKDISDKSHKYPFLYGFWNSITNKMLSPSYHDIDINSFYCDLIYTMKDDRIYYINSDGEIIWEENKVNDEMLTNLNIEFMNRGYFYANSKPHKDDIGGFSSSKNFQEKILNSERFNQNTISIVVDENLRDTIFDNYNAMTVYIANNTNKDVLFNAQDSRLHMKVQALNPNGEWADIEYLPNSWCGNSYHILTLEPRNYWKFLTPVYEGGFKTKLRIELKYIDQKDDTKNSENKKEITIYSNEYSGSINPAQFWYKKDYNPRGIMDSYNE